MWWWGRADGWLAGGWHAEAFGGDHVREVLLVKRADGVRSVWRRPALIVKVYEDGRLTAAEGEWNA